MAEASGLMRGKRGLIMGVANNRSIAWGIAKACRAQGAELAFTYQGDALKKRVEPLAEEIGGLVVGHCDVTDPATIDAVFATVAEALGHARFRRARHRLLRQGASSTAAMSTPRADNFTRTLLICCYSFTAVAQRAEKLMPNGGSLLTLTYYGAEKWMPHYNVMGVAKAALEASVRYLAADLGAKNIRVNAISAGPIKTLAASGIGDFRYILKWNEYNAPLRRTVTHRGGRRRGGLSPLRPVARRHRRSPSRRCRLPHRRHEASRRAGHRRSPRTECAATHADASSISSATARPTGTWQAGCKASTTFRSTRAAARRRRIAAKCCAICSSATASIRGDSTMSRARSGARRETMESGARGARPAAATAIASTQRLIEIAFGDWEGFTYRRIAQARAADVVAQREHDKWVFRAAGRRELCDDVARASRAWYASARRATRWSPRMAAPRAA